MTLITRRDSLTLGTGALAAAALGESRAKAAHAAAPKYQVEKDAALRVLRPTKFVEPDEIVFRQNTDKFSKETGVPVRVDFVGFEDLRPQTAVTANTGAGPDVVVGWMDDPHLYSDKLIEVTDLADYLGNKYGGWKFLAQTFGQKWKTDKWIAIPMGATGSPCNYRISWVKQAGFDGVPDDLDQFLTLCRKLKETGHPPGFALGNAVGDANAYANWLLWSHNAYLADENGAIAINRAQTIEALRYGKALQETFIPGTLSWQDPSNNKAFLAEQISLTSNGVSIYFVAKNDPKTAQIAADMDHVPMPKGLAKSTPESALIINAMAFKHTRYPNAAKEYIRFMMEAEQYEPWLNACLGYWSNPLKSYDAAAVWRGDPKVHIFRETLDREFWPSYQGPINAASAAIAANYVTVHMFAAVAAGQATPEEAASEAERQARRYYKS